MILFVSQGGEVFRKAVITKIVGRHGFSLSRDCEKFCMHGDYARNIQLVFSKQDRTNGHEMIHRLYVGVNLYREKLVIGLIREYLNMNNGVIVNTSDSISLSDYNESNVESLVKKLLSFR